MIRCPTTEWANWCSRLDKAFRNGDGSGLVRVDDGRGLVRASGPRNLKDTLPILTTALDFLSVTFQRHQPPCFLNTLHR